MTDSDAKEIKAMLNLIMEHLGIGKNPILTRHSAKETAEKILNLEREKAKRGHVGARSGK